MRLPALALIAALIAAPEFLAAQQAEALRWVPNPTEATRGWVSDPAHHLGADATARIDSIIFALERDASVEMAVVVIDSLDGLAPHDAALLLHRRWGVGKGDRNNGLVLLWSPALRQLSISVGYGLEGVITDAVAGRIEDDVIIPQFRQGKFDTGITGGVAALASLARRDTATVRIPGLAYHPPTSAAISGRRRGSRDDGGRPWWLLLFPAAAVPIGGVAAWRRRPRRCPHGHGAMRRLSEMDDDTALSREERLEESLRSVNYDVWRCDACAATAIVPHRRWFSRFGECATCHRRTALTTTTTIVEATYSHGGRNRVTTDCRNCGAHTEKEVATPMLTHSSSSGGSSGGGGHSSGGSSFGGGSAGGGGASRSY